MKYTVLLLLALLVSGCAPQSKAPSGMPSTSVTPVQTPVTTPVQVTMLAPAQTPVPDVAPLANSIRYCGTAVILAALIIAFGRVIYRACAKVRSARQNDSD